MTTENQPIETQALAIVPQVEYKPLNRSGDRRGIKHGYKFTRTYRIWCKMKERCNNPKAINFDRYGGRGVTVCERWNHSFEAFLYDMGECPAGLTIERLDSTKGYFKSNCKWATKLEQASNKSNNVMVEFRGEIKSVAQWCRDLDLKYAIVRQRIYRDGWSAERAFGL